VSLHLKGMKKLLNLKSALISTLVLIVLLGAAQLVLANSMSGEGQKIRGLEEQKSQLQKETQSLEKEVATLGSLSRIETKANELGLSYNVGVFEYLSPPKLAQAQ